MFDFDVIQGTNVYLSAFCYHSHGDIRVGSSARQFLDFFPKRDKLENNSH